MWVWLKYTIKWCLSWPRSKIGSKLSFIPSPVKAETWQNASCLNSMLANFNFIDFHWEGEAPDDTRNKLNKQKTTLKKQYTQMKGSPITRILRIWHIQCAYALVSINGFPFIECRASFPQDMMATYSVVYFWLEVVSQFVIGIAGFIANMVVIPILCWYEHSITAWYRLV